MERTVASDSCSQADGHLDRVIVESQRRIAHASIKSMLLLFRHRASLSVRSVANEAHRRELRDCAHFTWLVRADLVPAFCFRQAWDDEGAAGDDQSFLALLCLRDSAKYVCGYHRLPEARNPAAITTHSLCPYIFLPSVPLRPRSFSNRSA